MICIQIIVEHVGGVQVHGRFKLARVKLRVYRQAHREIVINATHIIDLLLNSDSVIP